MVARKNNVKKLTLAVVLTVACLCLPVAAQHNINLILMHYTFKIEGPSVKEPGKTSFGTVFLVGKAIAESPGDGRIVMVTAAHVLAGISGEKATVHFRQKTSEGKYKRKPHVITIRRGKTPLWTKHPKTDVAAMVLPVPRFVTQGEPMLSDALLGTDEVFERFEIAPGDQLVCLGYPLGAEANEFGFPILRSGRIASFPLIPAEDVRSFLFDFEVFGGNSGGPVYFRESGRYYAGTHHLGQLTQFVAGLVSEQKINIERKVTQLERSRRRRRFEIEESEEMLKLAVVIPAHFIKETINMLPKDETTPKPNKPDAGEFK